MWSIIHQGDIDLSAAPPFTLVRPDWISNIKLSLEEALSFRLSTLDMASRRLTYEMRYLPLAGRRTHSGASPTSRLMSASLLDWPSVLLLSMPGELISCTWYWTVWCFNIWGCPSHHLPSHTQVGLASLLVCSGHHVLGSLCGWAWLWAPGGEYWSAFRLCITVHASYRYIRNISDK